jgi:hypothetical protein
MNFIIMMILLMIKRLTLKDMLYNGIDLRSKIDESFQ